MKKNRLYGLVALLVVVVMVFSGCEMSFDIGGDNDTTVAGDSVNHELTDGNGQDGSSSVGSNVNEAPVVTVVDVTNQQGEVVATEKVTLSKDEVQSGKDFFVKPSLESDENKNVLPSPDRLTQPNKENTTQNDKKPGNKDDVDDKNDVADNGNNNNNNNNNTNTGDKNDNTDNNTDNGGTNDNSQDVVQKNDLDIIYSKKYYIEGRIVANGNVSYYKVARDGKYYSAVTTYEGNDLGIIVGDTDVYLVAIADKTYIKVPKSMIEEEAEKDENMQGLLTGDAFDMNKKPIETTTEEADGITYTVLKYEDGSADYLNGNIIVKSVASDGSIMFYDVVTDNVSMGMFLPPAGYTEQVVNFTTSHSAECTDPGHNHG